MKFSLCLALLVLVASATVYGDETPRKGNRKERLPKTDEVEVHDDETTKGNKLKIVQKTEFNVDTDVNKVTPKKTVSFHDDDEETSTRRTKTVQKTEFETEHEHHSDEEHEDTTRRPRPSSTRVTLVTDAPVTELVATSPLRVKSNITIETEGDEKLPKPTRISRPDRLYSENEVHIRGNIVLTGYRPMAVDAVGYEVKTGRYNKKTYSSFKPRLPAFRDVLEVKSRVMLYVSTVKSVDPKLSFANFTIPFESDHFPLTYSIDVPLPREQFGLVANADLTLYIYAYITNLESRIHTYLPDGISQILLQGTNRVVQQLQVNVKSNGIELKGLFRSRYSDGYIRSGTAFQVVIVPEQSLSRLLGETIESVAQTLISQVPAMFPVPYSLLVPYQQLKYKTRYYAIAYIFENGVERLIPQKPVLVINEDLSLVTSEIIFTVVPNPFILHGTVTRSMPGSFYFEQNSSIILSIHEKNSETPAFTFRLPIITQLPQDIQVNISQAAKFDATKDYEILAMVMDSKNQIYMSSSKKIPILDQMSRLTLPVDDLYYYVELSLHSSANQPLTYIPGSKATVVVAENAEITSTPIYSAEFDPTETNFRHFLMRIPIARAQRYANAYLILLINNTGILTHVSRILLISNYQRPPLRLQLPVIALNIIRGKIFDEENRPAQWSSASYANLYLLDDEIANPEKAIVQIWKIHLERDFPINYEVPLDFSLLRSGHSYRLQASIENTPNFLEYRPANSLIVIKPEERIQDSLRIFVRNVKKFQVVKGLIYMTDVTEPLPARSQVIIQMSSSSVWSRSEIVHELRLNVEGGRLPLNFTLELPLERIDISSVYYIFVKYLVGETTLIPSTQAFAFSPRNDATVIIKLSRTPQVRITGQVASTGGRLILPEDSTLHLYVTDSAFGDKPTIYSEVSLRASSNSYYQFTMYLDSIILQQNVTLYLRADILYKRSILLSMPRAALLQITPSGEWNINLIVDLPTLLVGQINLLGQQEVFNGDFEAYIQIVQRGTENVVSTTRIRLTGTLPQSFRVEIDNSLIVEYGELEARAIIKNCREEILFKSGGSVKIHARINVDLGLPVVLTNPEKLKELNSNITAIAPIAVGEWKLSATNVDLGTNYAVLATLDERSTRREF